MAKNLEFAKMLYRWGTAAWAKVGDAVVVTAFVALGIFISLLLTSPWLDTLDRRGWQCEIDSAQPVSGGKVFRGGEAGPHIFVTTKNCGSINIEGKTVNPDSPELTAAKFEPGSQWVFEIGWYSRNIAMPIERRSPTSEVFHRVAGQEQ